MAVDLALLERAAIRGESWLRLYQWDPHCLSFGRHEPASLRYDAGLIHRLGLDTVRRPTGGRAVWHGRELTYAIAAPITEFGSLRSGYLEIHAMLGSALERLGAAVTLAPRRRTVPLDAGACFLAASGGEVLIAGHKVVGSAQLRRGTAFLQHGSILVNENQEMVRQLTRDPRSGSVPASSLAQLLRRRIDPTEVADAVAAAAANCWGGEWLRASHQGVLLDAAQHFQHFRSPAWTWAR